MGKSKKELKRFESVAFIALEALEKAIKMKSLQIEELKMKQNHEKEMAILNKKPLNTAEKFPSGGLVESKGEGEILIPKWLRSFDLKKEEERRKEKERLQKLPEIEKAERYINEVMKVEIPALKTAEIAEVIAEFKNKLKLASDEALKSLKK